MRALAAIFVLVGLVGCGSERESFDLACGELVCDGAIEACWDDCGASDESERYSCQPLPDKCLRAGATDACLEDDCSGSLEDGVSCDYICG